MDAPPHSPVAPFAFLRSESHKQAQAAVFSRLVAESRAEYLGSCSSGSSSSGSRPGPLRLRPLTVVVRKRPLNAAERQRSEYDVLTIGDSSGAGYGPAIAVHEPRTRYDLSQSVHSSAFAFDRAYGEGVSTAQLYSDLLAPVLPGLPRGLQATVFAYGQTGSGKSFSMGGLTEAALRDVFALCAASPTPLLLAVSYFEIYCSRCFDLLNGRAELALREDGAGAVQVVGLTEHCTASPAAVAELLARGAGERSMGVTRVNADSSRSHSVLHIAVRERGGGGGGGGGAASASAPNFTSSAAGRLLGRLTLVDLAGSEAACDADPPDKATHREAAEINKSLLALKECIRAMARQQRGAVVAAAAAAAGGGGGRRASKSTKHDSAQWFKDYAKGPGGGGPPLPPQPVLDPDFGVASAVSKGIARGMSGGGGRRGGAAPPPPAHTHVPYRGSKLTQVLKDCFTSPGALTIMLATTGPSSAATEHSLNTLRYAARLKEIGMGREGGGGEAYWSPAAAAGAAAAAVSRATAKAAAGGLPRSRPASPLLVRENSAGALVAPRGSGGGGGGGGGASSQAVSRSVPWWVRGHEEGAGSSSSGASSSNSSVVLDADTGLEVGATYPSEAAAAAEAAAPLAPLPRSRSASTTGSAATEVLPASARQPPPPPPPPLPPRQPSSAAAAAALDTSLSEDVRLISLLDDQIGQLMALRSRVSGGGEERRAGAGSAHASQPHCTPTPTPASAAISAALQRSLPRGFVLPPQPHARQRHSPPSAAASAAACASAASEAPRPVRSISSASAMRSAKAVAVEGARHEVAVAAGRRAAAVAAAAHRPSPYAAQARPGSAAGGGRGKGAAPLQQQQQRQQQAGRSQSVDARRAHAQLPGRAQQPVEEPVLCTTPRSLSTSTAAAASAGVTVAPAAAPPALPTGSAGAGRVRVSSSSSSSGSSGSALPPQLPPPRPASKPATSAPGTHHQQQQQPPRAPAPRVIRGGTPTAATAAATAASAALLQQHARSVPPSLLSSFLALVKKSAGGSPAPRASAAAGGSTVAAYAKLGGGPAAPPKAQRVFSEPMLPPPPPPSSQHYPLNPAILSAALMAQAANPARVHAVGGLGGGKGGSVLVRR